VDASYTNPLLLACFVDKAQGDISSQMSLVFIFFDLLEDLEAEDMLGGGEVPSSAVYAASEAVASDWVRPKPPSSSAVGATEE